MSQVDDPLVPQFGILRALVQDVVDQTLAKSRAPLVVPGNVEDISTDLDVAYVRMDNEAYGSEIPGVIAVQRQGNMQVDEQARVHFDRSAGATAYATSLGKLIVLPYGTESGQRLIIDGSTGSFEFYNDLNTLVGFLSAAQWFVGTEGSLLARLDPIGGLRLRDENDVLRAQLSATEGLTLREATAGITGLSAGADGLIVFDPETGEQISIASGTASAVPAPHYAGSQATSPGSSHSTPTVSTFDTGDEIDLRFVAASAGSNLGAQSYTPPTNYTERSDTNSSGSGITLATSAATRDPAIEPPGAHSFTNTSAGWTRRNGHSVIIRGGGSSSPAFRSIQSSPVHGVASSNVALSLAKPAGVVDGDLLVAFVAMAGPSIPVGWTVPEGWKQLGIQASGIGTTHVLASGIWYKKAGASEPTEYGITINMATADFTKFHAQIVAIQDPYTFPGGLDIRRNNRSMPRGLAIDPAISSSNISVTDAGLPVTGETSSDVPVLAGRNYRISYQVPIVTFASLNVGNIAGIRIEIDTGGGFTAFHRTSAQNAGGTFRQFIFLSRVYRPVADGTIDVRIRITDDASPGGYTITLHGDSDEFRRELLIEDIGAEF